MSTNRRIIYSFIIDNSQQSSRLDSFLISRIANWSRSMVHNSILEGRVRVNGRREKKGFRVSRLDRIEVYGDDFSPLESRIGKNTEEQSTKAKGGTIPPEIPVIYIDDWLIAVNKPEGIPCHPLKPEFSTDTNSVIRALSEKYPEVLLNPQSRDSLSLKLEGGLLHRLDNGTSGVLLFARDRSAYEVFMPLLRSGNSTTTKSRKQYVAVVRGKLNQQRSIKIDYPIAHSSRRNSGKMIAVGADNARSYRGKPRDAVSELTAIAYLPESDTSICTVVISAGQRHQIRCHLSAIGHPIEGDQLYSGEELPASGDSTQSGRLKLHHWRILLPQPFLEKKIIIEADIPNMIWDGREEQLDGMRILLENCPDSI